MNWTILVSFQTNIWIMAVAILVAITPLSIEYANLLPVHFPLVSGYSFSDQSCKKLSHLCIVGNES